MTIALQELIEWMDEQEYTPPYNDVRRKATELLEKEREIAQDYARFAIECDRKEMPILEFQDWIKL